MYKQRILQAFPNLRKPPSRWNVGNVGLRSLGYSLCTRSSSSNTEDWDDPARKIRNGTAKMTDLSIQELKRALTFRRLSFQDCFDRSSMEKRLADRLLKEHTIKNDPAKKAEMVHFVQSIPWIPFALSKDIIGSDKSVFLMIAPWEVDRARADFTKCGFAKDPAVSKQQRDFLVDCSDVILMKKERNHILDAKIGTAAVLLHLHGDNARNQDDVVELDRAELMDPETISKYHGIFPCMPPVPKNWSLDNSYAATPEKVLEAIAFARKALGECEAIEDLDKYRKG